MNRVTLITQFVKAMLGSYPSVIDELKPLTDCLYQVIHRYVGFPFVNLWNTVAYLEVFEESYKNIRNIFFLVVTLHFSHVQKKV